jgi:hypothetical protein
MNVFTKLSARVALLAGASLLLPASGALRAQETTLSIGSAADAFPAGPFGQDVDASVAMGQTFVRPTGPACAVTCYLQGFSFWLGNSDGLAVNSESLQFRAYLAQWDGEKVAAGTVQYVSDIVGGPAASSVRYDFSAPNIAIEAGTAYVAFLSVVGLAPAPFATTADFDIVSGDPADFPEGGWVYTNFGSSLDDLTSNAWDLPGDLPELQSRFEARFTATEVPEPAVLLLLAGGAVALALVSARRRV